MQYIVTADMLYYRCMQEVYFVWWPIHELFCSSDVAHSVDIWTHQHNWFRWVCKCIHVLTKKNFC